MSEEAIMELQTEDDYVAQVSTPYFLVDGEVSDTMRSSIYKEWGRIGYYYKCYEYGARFLTEGSNNDYTPSTLKYKKAAMIVNKEARFLFSNPPTFNVNIDDDKENDTQNAIIQAFLNKVLDKNNFNGKLLKALKDCFVGKRIAIMVNFNEDIGISITFLNSLSFIYELDDNDTGELRKFVGFKSLVDTDSLVEQRWFKKVYTKEPDGVYVEENLFAGDGTLVQTMMPRTKILLDYIPVTVVLNDGLLDDTKGNSELAQLLDCESYYSKLANADMDAERKSMNPIRYTVDASAKSTEHLPISPGSYWDLQTNQDNVNENSIAKVGILESGMNYSDPLKITLDRIENQMFEAVDVPNITSEQLAGVITSGKTIQALYWGLTVRCDEKMLAWGHSLKFVAETIIEGAKLYPGCISRYTKEKAIPDIPMVIQVENNYPIPEDVKEEKETDMAEVELHIMSRRTYNQKWRGISKEKADQELDQIKKEMDMLENSMFNFGNGNAGSDNDYEDSDNENGDSNNNNGVNNGKEEEADN